MLLRLPKQNKYPKKIHYKDITYKIRFVKNLNCYGETDPGKKEIRIKHGISEREMFKTLLHELLHLVELETPIKLKHKTVYKLEQAIFELLIDNFL